MVEKEMEVVRFPGKEILVSTVVSMVVKWKVEKFKFLEFLLDDKNKTYLSPYTISTLLIHIIKPLTPPDFQPFLCLELSARGFD